VHLAEKDYVGRNSLKPVYENFYRKEEAFMKKLVYLFFVVMIMSVAVSAQAMTVTFNQYEKFAGSPPSPTFSATIVDTAGGVRITMDHPVSSDADIVFSWFFNIVPPIPAAVTAASVIFVSGIEATGQGPTPGVLLAEDVEQADGDGKFDLVFTWPNSGSGEFIEGENSIYDVTGLTAAQFVALSTPVGGHGPYYSAVEQSAWWGQGKNPVPIPAAVWLFGTGLLGLIGVRRKIIK
jgi:hypothetical protein